MHVLCLSSFTAILFPILLHFTSENVTADTGQLYNFKICLEPILVGLFRFICLFGCCCFFLSLSFWETKQKVKTFANHPWSPIHCPKTGTELHLILSLGDVYLYQLSFTWKYEYLYNKIYTLNSIILSVSFYLLKQVLFYLINRFVFVLPHILEGSINHSRFLHHTS